MVRYPGQVAAEIDRLVVAGHEATPPLATFDDLGAHPGLLNTVAVVLLSNPITREDLGRIVPYLPPQAKDALVENNADSGIVTRGDRIALTDTGRDLAHTVASLQETAIIDLWQDAGSTVAGVEPIAMPLVCGALDIEPPSTPSAFTLFAAVVDRPTPEARVLRAITAMRYWRADAHRAALGAAGFGPSEAHALNRVWDAHRGVDRVGQGRDEPGKRGLAAVEALGLADDGVITASGIEQREAIEADTDARTAPLYEPLDDATRDQLLLGLRGLPG